MSYHCHVVSQTHFVLTGKNNTLFGFLWQFHSRYFETDLVKSGERVLGFRNSWGQGQERVEVLDEALAGGGTIMKWMYTKNMAIGS